MRLLLTLDVHHLTVDLRKLKAGLGKGKNFDYRWVPQAQWHIPLCFLGELGRERIHDINFVIEEAIAKHASFNLKLEGVWAYPSQEHGRLLWIGVQNSKNLRALQSDLTTALGTSSGEEGTYRPHLPIVRLKNFREVSDLISPYKNTDFGKVMINKVILYEMTSGGAFPTFRINNQYDLFFHSEPELTSLS